MASDRVFPLRAKLIAASAASPVQAPNRAVSIQPPARDGDRRRFRTPSVRGLGLLGLALFAMGCSELQARHHARAGNSRYLEGDYAGAVREYEVAEQKYPSLPVVALNKGLACRQM